MLAFTYLLLLLGSPVGAAEIWVDVNHGNDAADGLTAATALRTLQKATTLATAGSIVHIQPGIYRETLQPIHSGTANNPIIYQAEQPDSVIIRGAEVVNVWQSLTENTLGFPTTKWNQIVWADLSQWDTEIPRFVQKLDSRQTTQRLSLAREPDWQAQTEWKQHEFWWTADGGSAEVTCSSPTSCETPLRSLTQLTDRHNDNSPSDISKGNLTTLGNLTGATLVTTDNSQGYFIYRRPIVNHEVSEGRITISPKADYKTLNTPGLGWGSKYYVENHPALLDSDGEYWFDSTTKRLYILAKDLISLEISKRTVGVDLSNLSYITLDGITIDLCQETAIQLWNAQDQGSQQIVLKNLNLSYANHGIWIEQDVGATSTSANQINGLILENSQIANMDSDGLFFYPTSSSNANLTTAPLTNVVIKNNELHHLSYRAQQDRAAGLEFYFADKLRFENNRIHHTAFDGIKFSHSLIQSSDAAKTLGFTPQEIKTGDIFIHGNVIEKTCQMVADCGALTFTGLPPTSHIFRDVLIMNNTIRNNLGWSAVAELRGRWNGLFAFGIYANYSSGLNIYRNVLYKNSWANIFGSQSWRDGEMLIVNNVLANANYGLGLWSTKEYETHSNVNTQIINNIFVNNAEFGIHHKGTVDDAQFVLNHNLYYSNGWTDFSKFGEMSNNNNTYQSLESVQTQTPWELQGVSQDPLFLYYDYFATRNRYDNSMGNFQIRTGSVAINRGTVTPASLTALLARFGIIDFPQQEILDIGAFEYFSENQGIAIDLASRDYRGTAAQFFGKLEVAGANNFLFNQAEPVSLSAEIVADRRDIGQAAQIFMVGVYTAPQARYTAFMRQGDTWIPWDEKLETLAAAFAVAALPEKLPVAIYSGNLMGMPGNFTVYIGYAVNGVLAYNGQLPINFIVQ